MTDLDDVYSDRIMELAADISHTDRLKTPHASASAHSKLCGSTIHVDVNLDNDKVSAFGQDVKACLLGQVAASVVARQIVGTHVDEFRKISKTMETMLKDGGPPPNGRWSDLEILQPVKDYPHRHASTLLVFTALEQAIQNVSKGR